MGTHAEAVQSDLMQRVDISGGVKTECFQQFWGKLFGEISHHITAALNKNHVFAGLIQQLLELLLSFSIEGGFCGRLSRRGFLGTGGQCSTEQQQTQ
ncbi:hypothetical protein [Acinetobacter proteolyticus]|uniref:hypothetical protein n=1 Tax=Acinetobacter proteolyticus TaxID=1776741 RepID=UPI001F4DB77D|nr:hypothetical protein [Acinetobacter proteolyticus]